MLVNVFLAFLFECISFDFYYCLCVLLLRSFVSGFWLMFINAFHSIPALSQFTAFIIVVKKG